MSSLTCRSVFHLHLQGKDLPATGEELVVALQPQQVGVTLDL